MLTRAQAHELKRGDILDVRFISEAEEPKAVAASLRGKTIRVVVYDFRFELMPNSALDWSGPTWPDPIRRLMRCSALSGVNLPAHVTPIVPAEGLQATRMALYDWLIEGYERVGVVR